MSSDNRQSSQRRNEYLQQYSQGFTLFTEEESTAALDAHTTDLVELHDQSDAVQQFDRMLIDLPWNTAQKVNSLEDPILPQKSTLLWSTSTNNNKEPLLKDIQVEIEKVPNYLAKQHKSCQQIIQQVQSALTTTANANDCTQELRKIAILIYKVMVLQTYQLLWEAYLKSGLGELIIPSHEQLFYSIFIPIWPKEIKTFLPSSDQTNEKEIYFTFVQNQLAQLHHQLKHYQAELNSKANDLPGYTLNVQKLLETYVQENLQPFRGEIEYQIELLHYNYHIRASKLEYFRHQPNAHQEQLMKQICRSKYEQETTEQEYHLLEQQMNFYRSGSQSFECSSLAQSTPLDSVANPDNRQQLFQQYRENAVQSRANLFQLYLKSAEDQREKYKKKYEEDIKQLRRDHYSVDRSQHISWAMVQLIQQRCEKISGRIQCIYRFKAQLKQDELSKQCSE